MFRGKCNILKLQYKLRLIRGGYCCWLFVSFFPTGIFMPRVLDLCVTNENSNFSRFFLL